MIWYDSHRVRTLLKVRGSVLPKSLLWAIPSAVFAFCLRYGEEEGFLSLEQLKVLAQGDIYGGFTFVLGFSLVFRTSQAYLRYWTGATALHEMSCMWSDSCASLVAFASTSSAQAAEIQIFRHTVVRLFSLLHAVALTEITNIHDDLPLLDVGGLTKEQLVLLTQGHAQGKKVQIVLSWIKAYIIKMGECNLLCVPAPILTRVFQELGNGLVSYHRALQIVIWPFPFPYTQLNFLLIQVYTLITPVVISTWETYAFVSSLFTFVSVMCMVGLDLIACELENPFGDDPNDLPVVDMQHDMNKFLTMQLNPLVHSTPSLIVEDACLDYKKLVMQICVRHGQLTRGSSIRKHKLPRSSSVLGATLSIKPKASPTARKPSRMHACRLWRGAATTQGEINRLAEWLQCEDLEDSDSEDDLGEELESELGTGSALTSDSLAPPRRSSKRSEGDVCGVPPAGPPPVVPASRRGSVRPLASKASRTSSAGSPCRVRSPPAMQRTLSPVRQSGRQSSRTSSVPGVYHSDDWETARRMSAMHMEVSREWGNFLNALDVRLGDLFESQLEVQRRELSTLESMLTGILPEGSRRRGCFREEPQQVWTAEAASDEEPLQEPALQTEPDFLESINKLASEATSEDPQNVPPSMPPPELMTTPTRRVRSRCRDGAGRLPGLPGHARGSTRSLA